VDLLIIVWREASHEAKGISRSTTLCDFGYKLLAVRKRLPPQQLHKFLGTLKRIDNYVLRQHLLQDRGRLDEKASSRRYAAKRKRKVIDTLSLSLQEGLSDSSEKWLDEPAHCVNYPAYQVTDPEVRHEADERSLSIAA